MSALRTLAGILIFVPLAAIYAACQWVKRKIGGPLE